MRGAILLAIGLASSSAAPSAAQSVGEYVAHGYAVVRSTVLPGLFLGCHRAAELRFADGSGFVCGRDLSMVASSPPVVILARPGEMPSAVLIGGRAVPGGLTRLGERRLTATLPIAADGFADPPSTDPTTLNQLSGSTAIESLDATQRATAIKSLNALQLFPIAATRK